MEGYAKLHKKSWKTDVSRFNSRLAHWKDKKISQITKVDILKLHADMGSKNHKTGANRIIALLSVMFNKAKEFGLWDKPNPALGIQKFQEKSRDRFLQSEELPRFFVALAQEPNETIRDCILLAILTGARRANLMAMKWDEISWDRAEWRIPATKNGDPQTVALSEEAVIISETSQNNRH